MFPIYDFIVVYYEWMKQESKMRPIYECRCDERLLFKKMDQNLSLLWIDKVTVKDKTYKWVSMWWKTKNWNWGIYTSRIHWVDRGNETPKDKDEVKRREVYECDGWVCVLEVIDAPSRLRLTRTVSVLSRMLTTLDLNCTDTVVWRKWKCPLCRMWKRTFWTLRLFIINR
jgi:hypothetical protein